MPYDEMDLERDQEMAAVGNWIAEIEDALKQYSSGRYRDQFIYTDVYKDADLDPHGMLGIERLEPLNYGDVRVRVGGGKTFVDPAEQYPEASEISDVAHELVSDAYGQGNWTGDDWFFEVNEAFAVQHWDSFDAEKMAQEIIREFEKFIAPIQENWAFIDAALDDLYEEIAGRFPE